MKHQRLSFTITSNNDIIIIILLLLLTVHANKQQRIRHSNETTLHSAEPDYHLAEQRNYHAVAWRAQGASLPHPQSSRRHKHSFKLQ